MTANRFEIDELDILAPSKPQTDALRDLLNAALDERRPSQVLTKALNAALVAFKHPAALRRPRRGRK